MFTPRLCRLLWIAALTLWLGVWLFPVSTGLTRLAGVVLLGVVWSGVIALVWKRRAWRFALLGITAIAVLFVVWPSKTSAPPETLRTAYLRGLARYSGTSYYWGGESPKGIDCSGLMRRGMIDSLCLEGIQYCQPALIRQAIDLWWHDCTANDFMNGYRGLTAPVLATPSLNVLDHSRIRPGDMAVTANGVHILAYTGENRWIEADPNVGRVITLTAPIPENPWLSEPMKIVRWKWLE
jgi:hypothetical protein